jgi:hypothetical protein
LKIDHDLGFGVQLRAVVPTPSRADAAVKPLSPFLKRVNDCQPRIALSGKENGTLKGSIAPRAEIGRQDDVASSHRVAKTLPCYLDVGPAWVGDS